MGATHARSQRPYTDEEKMKIYNDMHPTNDILEYSELTKALMFAAEKLFRPVSCCAERGTTF